MNLLPVQRPHELEVKPLAQRWLVEDLWADGAVGILGGEPKCCKSFLALDLAVAVASGAPCLRRFPPGTTGSVLLFAAEDPLDVVRCRLEGIAAAAQVPFETLDIHVITAPEIRLDLERDQRRLEDTVASLRPKLLVLDPFVRLHRIDENVAAEVAPLLGFLRRLQRAFSTAIVLVHHARKGAAHARAGQALRGSGEIHAWGDSLLYLRRQGEKLSLTVEHRAARSIEGLSLELRACGSALSLHVADEATEPFAIPADSPTTAVERIQQALADSPSPLRLGELRSACRIKTSTLCQTLADLTATGRVLKSPDGYRLATS